jgi:conjugal transfer pilus assembly protein TraE
MRFKLFEKMMSNLLGENKLLKFVVIVIGCVELWNSHKIDQAMKYQRTILVPTALDKRVIIVGDRASEEYLQVFARLISNLAFNYNTASARGQFGALLQYFTSDTFPAAKTAFYSMADTIERTKVSSSFVINKPAEIDSEKSTITVTGVQRQWVESSFVDAAEKIYVIAFKMTDGRFAVTSIVEKSPNGMAAKKAPTSSNETVSPAAGGSQ